MRQADTWAATGHSGIVLALCFSLCLRLSSLFLINAHLERFVGALRVECLDRIIFFGEDALRRAVKSHLEHDHQERNHQGLGNTMIMPGKEVGRTGGEIDCRERLGGLLRYYHRRAA